jgi:hypothetical protein
LISRRTREAWRILVPVNIPARAAHHTSPTRSRDDYAVPQSLERSGR